MSALPPPPPDADAYEREVLTTPHPTACSVVRKYPLALVAPVLLLGNLILGVGQFWPRFAVAFWLVFFTAYLVTLYLGEHRRWQRRRARALRAIEARREEADLP